MLVRQMMRQTGYIAIGYLVLLELALVAAILYWPDFAGNLHGIMRALPFRALQELAEGIEKHGYWAYFGIQHFFKGSSLFGIAAAALLGSTMIAREADNGTAEFLLSRPVSRTRILLTRWSVGAVMICLPVFLCAWSGLLIVPSTGETLSFTALSLASLHTSLYLLAHYSITVWLSAASDQQLKPGIIVVGVALFQFALYLVEWVGDYSTFSLVDHEVLSPIQDGDYPWIESGALLAVAFGFLLLAWRRFLARDF